MEVIFHINKQISNAVILNIFINEKQKQNREQKFGGPKNEISKLSCSQLAEAKCNYNNSLNNRL